MNEQLRSAAAALLSEFRSRGLMLAVAESCTGGLVAAALTDIAGSSDVVDRGFVTYSNAAKQEMLGVPAEILKAHGAVSRETAEAMACGALAHSQAHVTASITGVAGPGGGNPDKPVGLVHFGAANRSGRRLHREKRFGPLTRDEIRERSVLEAFDLLRELARSYTP